MCASCGGDQWPTAKRHACGPGAFDAAQLVLAGEVEAKAKGGKRKMPPVRAAREEINASANSLQPS